MKARSPRELIEKARRVYREAPPEDVPLPAGFVDRAAHGLPASPSKQGPLVLWEWASYAGVAAAACLALVVWLRTAERGFDPSGNAADPWLDMPMNEAF